jgi:hypothetical protein
MACRAPSVARNQSARPITRECMLHDTPPPWIDRTDGDDNGSVGRELAPRRCPRSIRCVSAQVFGSAVHLADRTPVGGASLSGTAQTPAGAAASDPMEVEKSQPLPTSRPGAVAQLRRQGRCHYPAVGPQDTRSSVAWGQQHRPNAGRGPETASKTKGSAPTVPLIPPENKVEPDRNRPSPSAARPANTHERGPAFVNSDGPQPLSHSP